MLKNKIAKLFLWCFFAAYILLILKLTILRNGADIQVLNLFPFRALIKIFRSNDICYFLYLFLGNIVCFMPFGFILPLLIPNISMKKVIFFTFLFSIFIEVSQYTLMVGYTELDDILLNTLGGLLGYLSLVKRRVFVSG